MFGRVKKFIKKVFGRSPITDKKNLGRNYNIDSKISIDSYKNEKSGFEGSEKKFRSKLSEAVQDENMKVFTKEKKLKRSRLLAKREKKITEHKAIQAIDDEEICPWGQLV